MSNEALFEEARICERETRDRNAWNPHDPEREPEKHAAHVAQVAERLRADEAEDEARFYRWRAEMRARTLASSGLMLPHEHTRSIVAGAIRDTDATRAVRAWIAKPDRPLLVLAGAIGCGKTTGAAVALTEARSAGKPFTPHRYRAYSAEPDGWGHVAFDCGSLARALNTLRRDDDAVARIYRDVVVLDDLGTRENHPDFAPALIEFIDARLSVDGLTVITTNLSREDIAGRYDARTVDRLFGHGRYVTCSGKSMRRSM